MALRYFNVFGPRQSPVSEYGAVIPNFFSAALLDEQPVIYGDGEQTRDFTYVENVVQANLLAAQAKDAAGHVFNVARGESRSLLQLLEAIGRVAGRELEPVHVPARAGDVRGSLAAIDRAREVLCYDPQIDLDEGLRRTHEFFSTDATLLPRIQERRRWLQALG